ncbi:unnamed protein product [Albugo candida]|uniref:Uncharacterized protein n=1 Tax=Albugo candida TaxID=65357 RepID=A0A024GEB4_9STRA|nr:unnamed protein product [Albugo candida]|eukprot:CCI45219.1 unnamed protein product [Albugo candida]
MIYNYILACTTISAVLSRHTRLSTSYKLTRPMYCCLQAFSTQRDEALFGRYKHQYAISQATCRIFQTTRILAAMERVSPQSLFTQNFFYIFHRQPSHGLKSRISVHFSVNIIVIVGLDSYI